MLVNRDGHLIGMLIARFDDSNRGRAVSYIRLWDFLDTRVLGHDLEVENNRAWAISNREGWATIRTKLFPFEQPISSAWVLVAPINQLKVVEIPEFATSKSVKSYLMTINDNEATGRIEIVPAPSFRPILAQIKLKLGDGQIVYGPIQKLSLSARDQQVLEASKNVLAMADPPPTGKRIAPNNDSDAQPVNNSAMTPMPNGRNGARSGESRVSTNSGNNMSGKARDETAKKSTQPTSTKTKGDSDTASNQNNPPWGTADLEPNETKDVAAKGKSSTSKNQGKIKS